MLPFRVLNLTWQLTFVPSCFVGLKQSYLRLHASLLEQLTLCLSTSDWLAYDPGRGVQAEMTYLITFVCLSLKPGIWLSILETDISTSLAFLFTHQLSADICCKGGDTSYIADLGEARGCSTSSVVIDSFSH